MNYLASELNLSVDELDSYMHLFEFNENKGSGDEGIYGYYTYIPDGIDYEIMKRNGWYIGECIYLSCESVECKMMVFEKNIINVYGKISELIDGVNEKKYTPSYVIDYAIKLGMLPVGDLNYSNVKVELYDSDGYVVQLELRSYDPSGPFQNLPDITKLHLSLFFSNIKVDGKVIRLEE